MLTTFIRYGKWVVFAIVILCDVQVSAQQPSGYNPLEYHSIQLGTAKSMTGRFQLASPALHISVKAGTVAANVVERLLTASKAEYLKHYFALDDAGRLQMLLVPRSASGEDIVSSRILTANGLYLPESTARKWIQAYAKSEMFTKFGKVYATSIHADAIRAVVKKNNATTLNFYFANTDDSRMTTVVSGNTSDGTEATAYIADRTCCPPDIDGGGELSK